MPLDAWIKALHIAFFALGLAMSEGVSLFVQSLLRAGLPDADLLAVRAKYFDRIGGAAWLLCAATGILLIDRLELNWSEKWLSISICLFAVLALNGVFGHARWLNHIALSNGDRALLRRASRLKARANLISLLAISTILALMVVKPV